MKVLFVCSQGVIRSRTAEILCTLGGMNARSCGIDEDAVTPISNGQLLWADEIVCMGREHSKIVSEMMGSEGKPVCSLGIPDDYDPFDDELVALLIGSLRHKVEEASMAIETGWGRFRELGLSEGLIPKKTIYAKTI